ncbi:MAG TPA: ATP-binding cassette domain-containing protein [Streptosporangiaceae bacterium]|nr:ATP-binding cassette domain-containing protein [Streptosporangiaceae bacterium]
MRVAWVRRERAGHSRPSPSDRPAIEADRLVKRFSGKRALAGVDLAVPRGIVYGLLGPNGAGKTTAVRILATLLAPDGGRATVAGHDVASEPHLVRRVIALAGQSATVDEDLTGRENLVFLGRLAGLSRAGARARAAELVTAFGLEEAASRPAKEHSGGMRRRLDLAASLIARAEVYFLDEPTTGLDPASRNQVHQFLRALAADGATVLLTTQYLDEADHLAARIAVIDHGTVIAEGTPGELKAAAGAGVLRVRLADPAQRPQAGHALARLLRVPVQDESDPALLTATVPASGSRRPAIEQAAAAVTEISRAGITVGEFALGQPSLDEVFLSLTGRHVGSSAPAADGSQIGAPNPSSGRKGSS